MGRIIFLIMLSLLVSAPATASFSDEATHAVTNILDKFNAGDIDAFLAAHQPDAVIVDEFAPYVWTGASSARRWADDYGKDAQANGISGGRVDYGKPLQANSDGNSAYIVLPTTYSFLRKGKKMAGEGSMTFVMTRMGADWKIASWTYSGAAPKPK